MSVTQKYAVATKLVCNATILLLNVVRHTTTMSTYFLISHLSIKITFISFYFRLFLKHNSAINMFLYNEFKMLKKWINMSYMHIVLKT